MVRHRQVQLTQPHQRFEQPFRARYGNWNHVLIVKQGGMAVSEYNPGLLRPTGGEGLHRSRRLASSNQIVRFPRLTRAWSYADQFVTWYRCFIPISLLSGRAIDAMTHLLALPKASRFRIMSIDFANAMVSSKSIAFFVGL